jgi:hypothetical protein
MFEEKIQVLGKVAIHQEKVLVVNGASGPGHNAQDPGGTPQINMSMLMPSYPGPDAPLFGVRLFCRTSGKSNARKEQCDILFQADCLSAFQRVLDDLRHLKKSPIIHQQAVLSNPYPTQIVDEDQIAQMFVHRTRPYRQWPLRVRRILNPEWEEFDCKYRSMSPENQRLGKGFEAPGMKACHVPWGTPFSHGYNDIHSIPDGTLPGNRARRF